MVYIITIILIDSHLKYFTEVKIIIYLILYLFYLDKLKLFNLSESFITITIV